MNWNHLINRCLPLRKLRSFLLWMRGGTERSEVWQGDHLYLRQITYEPQAINETAWEETGKLWVENWILPPLSPYRRASWHVLEIGCGPGRILQPLASHFIRVVGIDFSEDMVEYAKSRLRFYSNIEVRQNDGQTIPYPDLSFDLVISLIAFQHMNLATIKSYYQETYRVLKPGGLFRFQTRRDVERRNASIFDRHFLTKVEVKKLADTFGFSILSYEAGLGHPTWHWFTLRKPVS